MRNIIRTGTQSRAAVHVEGLLFHCACCGQNKPVQVSGGTGYGVDAVHDSLVCYACCAIRERGDMDKTGRATLYLSPDPEINAHAYKVTNWSGTLRFPVGLRKVGRHNLAGRRYDVWFSVGNETWHGVQYGDNTQITHCRRVRS